jgi:hypothetical protein
LVLEKFEKELAARLQAMSEVERPREIERLREIGIRRAFEEEWSQPPHLREFGEFSGFHCHKPYSLEQLFWYIEHGCEILRNKLPEMGTPEGYAGFLRLLSNESHSTSVCFEGQMQLLDILADTDITKPPPVYAGDPNECVGLAPTDVYVENTSVGLTDRVLDEIGKLEKQLWGMDITRFPKFEEAQHYCSRMIGTKCQSADGKGDVLITEKALMDALAYIRDDLYLLE